MKKIVNKAACLLLVAGLISGCSMNDKNNKNDDMNKVADASKDAANKAKGVVNDSIDNVMNYFKKEGLKFENSKNLENIDFAAHEGRSFDMNGKTAYLYRVKSDDENMKKILKEAKDKGKVKVNIDNKEQMYGAKINGDYLLLYDEKANMNDMLTAFPNYQVNGVNNPEGSDTNNSTKTNAKTNPEGQDNSKQNQSNNSQE